MNTSKTFVHRRIHRRLNKHITKHGHCHLHSYVHFMHHLNYHLGHLWELIIITGLSFVGFIFASHSGVYSNLSNNSSLVYPLQKVSTVECRVLERETMPADCKINLPIIYGNNINKYKSTKIYRDIYTVLRVANYTDTRDQGIGAHAGVDIATAKGTPLYAIGAGEVYFAGWNNGYGNVIKIRFKYQGEILYAVYAHMDKIHVQKGQMIFRGQQIGTVGNSGNTFGALGGYHVHFEINKDRGGRPAYYYSGCPELKHGHYQIIQNGYCREQIFQSQYNAISLIESSLGRGIKVDNTLSRDPNRPVDDIIPVDEVAPWDKDKTEKSDKEPEIVEKEEIKEPEIVEKEEIKEPEKNEKVLIVDNKHNSADDPIEPDDENNKEIDQPTDQPEIIEEDEVQSNVEQESEKVEEDQNIFEKEILQSVKNIKFDELKELQGDFSALAPLVEHFLSQVDIRIFTDLESDTLLVGETYKIYIIVHQKNTQQVYDGKLLVPFNILTNNRGVSLEYKNISSIHEGVFIGAFTAKKEGDSAIIINLGQDKVFTWRLNVKKI